MAITIRNEKTLKKLDALLKKNGDRTKTGLIDKIVGRFSFLESDLKAAKAKINTLEKELCQIKNIVREKARADQNFDDLCKELETQ